MRLDAKTTAALALPASKVDVIHFDSALPGFGYRLRQGAGGRVLRSWVAQYRRAGGTRRVLLGSADVLTAEMARQAAKKLLAKVALGEDPQGDRADRRQKDRISLRSVIDEYLLAKKTELRPRSLCEVMRYLTGPYLKSLHAMPIDTVSRKDVAAQLVAISRERGSVTAGQARAALSAFYVWAMQMGIATNNPVLGTLRPAEAERRERVLSDTELVAIWRAAGDSDFGRIIRLLILLGARRSEVGGMAWSEIDFDRGTWTLPKERSKNARAHTLPLMPAALEIINAVPRQVDRDQLFGARSKDGFGAWAKSKRSLDRRSKIADWTIHDVRRSVATKLADIGVQPHIIEQVLNHQSGHRAGVAGIYNRSSYQNEVRAALALWAEHVSALVEGRDKKVVAIWQSAVDGR